MESAQTATLAEKEKTAGAENPQILHRGRYNEPGKAADVYGIRETAKEHMREVRSGQSE